jgi:hypothetical protein
MREGARLEGAFAKCPIPLLLLFINFYRTRELIIPVGVDESASRLQQIADCFPCFSSGGNGKHLSICPQNVD